MKILLTGGSGDLGQVLVPLLESQGHSPIIFDIRTPASSKSHFIRGSLLESQEIKKAIVSVDVVIHIAAWHGIHETRRLKQPRDFWELNVNGSYNLLEACAAQDMNKLIHISSTSIAKPNGIYGFTKRLAEQAMVQFNRDYGLEVITLRPRAFIPHWNRAVYSNYLEWVRRFWIGAVHIQDVTQAVLKSLLLITGRKSAGAQVFTIDRAQDFPNVELDHWDENGPGSSFRTVFSEFEDLILKYGLDPGIRPMSMDISAAKQVLGYQPEFGLKELLLGLQEYDLNSNISPRFESGSHKIV